MRIYKTSGCTRQKQRCCDYLQSFPGTVNSFAFLSRIGACVCYTMKPPFSVFVLLVCGLALAAASSCGQRTVIEGSGTCVPIQSNTFIAATDSYYANICLLGQQPNPQQTGCVDCPPGTYRPLHADGFLHDNIRPQAFAIRQAQTDYYLCRTRLGTARVQLPTATSNCDWWGVPGVNGAVDTFSLVAPDQPTRYLGMLTSSAAGGRDFNVNMTSSSGTTAWKNSVTLQATSANLAIPNDDDNMPLPSYFFNIIIAGNVSMMLDCDLPKQISGATDGDCYFRNKNALNTYQYAQWKIAPPVSVSETAVTSTPTVRTYEGAAVTPAFSANTAVSLRRWGRFSHYATKGADNLIYAQLGLTGYARKRASPIIVPGLDGTTDSISLQDRDDPTKYWNARLLFTARGVASMPVRVSVPEAACDATFQLVQGVTNGSYAIDGYSLRSTCNDTYYLYANMTSDRANPVIMKNFSNPLTTQWFEKHRATWQIVSGLVDKEVIPHNHDLILKSRYYPTYVAGHDQSTTVVTRVSNQVVATSAIASTTNWHIGPPLGYVRTAACPLAEQVSAYFMHTTGVRYWVYAYNTTTSGDVYATYNARTTITPDQNVANAVFPDSFVFCFVPPSDPTAYQFGTSLSLANDTATLLTATTGTFTFTRPQTLTQRQQATFVVGGPLTVNYFVGKSRTPTCLNCPAGYASSSWASSSCTKCAAGTYAAAGSTLCSTCPAGTYSAAGAAECGVCDAGSSSEAGASSCSTCEAGKYSLAGGLCTNCAGGSFSSESGATACTTCEAGTYAATGASVCSDCDPGYFAEAEGSNVCQECPQNTFAALAGATTCTQCAQNECFTEETASVSAHKCSDVAAVSILAQANCLAATVDRTANADCANDNTITGLSVGVGAAGVVALFALYKWMSVKNGWSPLSSSES